MDNDALDLQVIKKWDIISYFDIFFKESKLAAGIFLYLNIVIAYLCEMFKVVYYCVPLNTVGNAVKIKNQ